MTVPRRVLNLFGETPAGRVRLLGAAVVACVALVALGFTLISRIHTGEDLREQAHAQCVQIEQLKAAITDVFEDGLERLEANRPSIDPDRYQESLDYYHRQLSRFRPKEC